MSLVCVLQYQPYGMADVAVMGDARLADALGKVHPVVADDVFGGVSGFFGAARDFLLHCVAVPGWGDRQAEDVDITMPQRVAGRPGRRRERHQQLLAAHGDALVDDFAILLAGKALARP